MRQLDMQDPERRVIGRVLREQAEHIPDDVYLMMDDRRISFGEANAAANSYAEGLTRLGVGPRDRVVIFMENSLEFALLALAVNKLGAAWVPVNTTYKGAWLRETLADADASLLVAHDELFGRVLELDDVPIKRAAVLGRSASSREGSIECIPFGEVDTGSTREPDVDVTYRDVSAVMWTSGTTGRSKGVMQTHSCWLWGAQILRQTRLIEDGDVLYCPVPMFNSGGWVFNVFEALNDGLPIGIDKHFSVTEFWDRVRYYGATQTVTLGAMHMYLWQAPPRADDAANPLRIGGFIPMPQELMGPFKERFGIQGIWQAYGQSEVMPATIASPNRSWKSNSAGTARTDLEVKLLDDCDREVATGDVGEICVRPRVPDAIFQGYFGHPEATLAAYRNLWYHTGDLGRFDADGELFFVDRKADYMRHKGRNISSFDVERAAMAHPAIREAAAHGVPAAELQSEEEVKLCAVRHDGSEVSAEEVAAFINEHAPYYLVPRYIEFLDELPHTPTGRVQKFKLRERGVTAATWDREASGFVVDR